MDKNKSYIKKIGGIILIIIILLLLLVQCGGETEKEAVEQGRNLEQEIVQIMKEDESYLIALFERGDICSEEWIKDFLLLIEKFQTYEYKGEEKDIQELILMYQEYAKELKEVAIYMQEGAYEESIEKLELVEETAIEVEGELNSLYEKYN